MIHMSSLTALMRCEDSSGGHKRGRAYKTVGGSGGLAQFHTAPYSRMP